MEYVATETSNQFVQAGFGEGTYGPETLGIIFKPAKWQEKKGLPGSTYHYAVPTNIYQRMMAAKDIDAYFNDTIKAHPEQYPYAKVEAGNPTPPAPYGSGKETEPPSLFTSAGGADVESPVTSLAVIDTLEDSALFASGGVTDAQLAAWAEKIIAGAPKGIETEEQRKALKRYVRDNPASVRIRVGKRAEAFTRQIKDQYDDIGREKRRLMNFAGMVESAVLAPLTEWEQEDEARKLRLANAVNELSAKGQRVYMDIAEIESAIAELETFDVSTMQEYKVGAESAIGASLRVLKPELERRREAEANARELAELRRKQAERDEADRLAEEKRQEQARIDAAVQAKLDAALESAKAATRQEVIAEIAPEKCFHSPEAVQAAQEYTVAERRQKIMDEAAEALVGLTLTRTEAMRVVSAIADGEIPHISISY
jgi:hypothetical protein